MKTTGHAELLHGTLDMLVLKAVTRQPMHGFGIARWIETVTGRQLSIEEGALYPALHRMEQRGWLNAEWGTSAHNRRARFYSITAAGRQHLQAEIRNWKESSTAVNRILRHA